MARVVIVDPEPDLLLLAIEAVTELGHEAVVLEEPEQQAHADVLMIAPCQEMRSLVARLRASCHGMSVIHASGQRWHPPHYDPSRTFGLLILDGLLGRRVRVGRTVGTELLGVGDIIRPWDDAYPFELIPAALDWRVFSPTRMAVLDERI